MIGWKEYRVKDIARQMGSGTTPSSKVERYYDSEDYHWINSGDFNDSEVYGGKQMISELAVTESSALRFYMPDTVLVAMYGASIGKVGMLKVKATVNQACCAIIPNTKKVLPYFLFYLFINSKDALISKSFGGTQPNVSQGIIANMIFCVPSLSAQQKIVDYLDEKTSAIDTQVKLLEKKKDAYTRLKKAMINRAVTRGLDENVKLKDSGVEWIGMIPEHWEVKRIKEIGKLKLGKMLDEKPKCGYQLKPYLKSKNIGWLELKLDEVEDMYFSDDEMKVLRLFKGDLVLSEGGEVGKTSYWNDELDECYIQNSVQKLTIDNNNFSRYYLYLSYLMGQMGYYKSIVNLVSIMHLTHEKLRQVAVIRPPLSEQMTIATYLDEKCTKIDAAITNIDKQTDALKRLKRSLINEVISGKRMIE